MLKFWDVRLVLADDCKPDGPLPYKEILNTLRTIDLPAGIRCGL